MSPTPKPALQKIGIKPGMRVAIVNAPADVLPLLASPDGTLPDNGLGSGNYDAIVLFVRSRAEVEANAPTVIRASKPGALLWFAYPKKAKGKGQGQGQGPHTDISRDAGWETVRGAGWDTVSLVAINSTWAALRFRPIVDIASTSPRRATR